MSLEVDSFPVKPLDKKKLADALTTALWDPEHSQPVPRLGTHRNHKIINICGFKWVTTFVLICYEA